jgi:hypothetical protein
MIEISFIAKRSLATSYNIGDTVNLQIDLQTYDKESVNNKSSVTTLSGRRVERLRNIRKQVSIETISIPPADLPLWEMFQDSVASGEPFVYTWPEEDASIIAQVVGSASLTRTSNGGYNKKSCSFTLEII